MVHSGIQGTNVRTHNAVLVDETNRGADRVQQLTYRLGYSYTRCTRAAAVVRPVHYTSLAAERAQFSVAELSAEVVVQVFARRDRLQFHWGLVERMCKYDPSEIIAVVDELEKLVEGSQGREEAAGHDTRAGSVLTAREDAESVVAEMKQMATSSSESDGSHKAKLARTYRQLWSRIERAVPSSKIEEDALWCDVAFLGIVANASGSTKRALASPCVTLVRFTELALRGYSLHRRLDKLIASKRLSPYADVMLDQGWKEV
ncbi:hypothetical protein BBJ28_00013095 [Nothophytophthora sp. Chile5]|nr:hypothetical protein BBJ28_00013095 [Nothophytophthora sp. Chile5]